MSFRQAIRKLEGKDTSLRDGVLVRIKRDSRYYGISEGNPVNISGTLSRQLNPYGDHIWEVYWSNYTVNSYRTIDLEVVS